MVTTLQRRSMTFSAFVRVGIVHPTCMEGDETVVFLDLVMIGRQLIDVIAATTTVRAERKRAQVRVLRQVCLLRGQAVIKADRCKHIHEAVREGRIFYWNRRSVDVNADQRFRDGSVSTMVAVNVVVDPRR